MRAVAGALAAAALLLAAASANAQQQGVQTIRPGMTEQEVRDIFGNPANRSSRGEFTYYFYENNCQRECGMADLVIFQNGQVVDAILRATWRSYAGESSSPSGVTPKPTPMRLQLPATGNEVRGIEVRPMPPPPPPPPPPPDTTASDSTAASGG